MPSNEQSEWQKAKGKKHLRSQKHIHPLPQKRNLSETIWSKAKRAMQPACLSPPAFHSRPKNAKNSGGELSRAGTCTQSARWRKNLTSKAAISPYSLCFSGWLEIKLMFYLSEWKVIDHCLGVQ